MNRRALLFAVILLAFAIPMSANDRAGAVVREVLAMHEANVSDAVIYEYFAGSDSFALGSDDVIDLTNAGISDGLIRDLLSLSNRRQSLAPRAAPAYYPSYGSYYAPYYGSSYPWWFYVGVGFSDHHFGHHFPPFYHDHHYYRHPGYGYGDNYDHHYYGHGYGYDHDDHNGQHGYAHDNHGSSPGYHGGHSYLPHYDSVTPSHLFADTIDHAVHHASGHDSGHEGHNSHSQGGHGGGHAGGGHHSGGHGHH